MWIRGVPPDSVALRLGQSHWFHAFARVLHLVVSGEWLLDASDTA